MSFHRASPAVDEANQAYAHPPASLASAIVAWAAIVFVSPVAILAFNWLVPTTVELLDRFVHYPRAPRLPLTIILIAQVALIALPATTFISWRRDRRRVELPHRTSKTLTLGCATLALGLVSYIWIARTALEFSITGPVN